ncbi:MAG: ribonuclease P protein component [Alphaproteobacteria bacterium]|nr:ribonuclease P protein component [Alphaproteobacteria bacterium]
MRGRVGRITRRADFVRIAGRNRRWVTPGLTLQTDRAPTDAVRVGFTVTRRLGKAVARNRIKRRLRAVAEHVLEHHALPGQDFVVIGRSDALTRPFAALCEDMEKALKGLHLWTDTLEAVR